MCNNIFYYELNKRLFPAKIIFIDGKTYTVSIDDLNELLFDDYGYYISDEAKNIDEEIFFYLPKGLFILSDDKIKDIIREVI